MSRAKRKSAARALHAVESSRQSENNLITAARTTRAAYAEYPQT